MSLNFNTNLYNSYGIDTQNLSKIKGEFFKESNNEPKVQSIDYSKFNRASLGVDLYSNRTNVDLQKQIALTQAGLYAKSVDVARLNSQAAANLYSASTVQKNVELTQSIAQGADLGAPKKLENNQNVIQLFNIQDKNSNSSNGFNPFRSNEEETEEKEEKSVSVFA